MSFIIPKYFTFIAIISMFVTISAFAAPIGTACFALDQSGSQINKLSSPEIARILGWIRDPHSSTLCGGRYVDSSNILSTQHPLAMQDMPINVTSSKNAFFTQQGVSVVKGDVTLIQPGREITSDCAAFYRNSKTGKISNGFVVGHVNFREYGKLIYAEQGNLNFVTRIYTMDNGFYRLLGSTPSGVTNVWGRAKHAVRDAMGILKMRKATYSACPPDATSWHLWSNNLILDRNTGRGEATNTVIFLKQVPVFYTPYLSFPIDKRRESGFLYPSVSNSKDSGNGISLPYYFNLAPNYDATVTPNFFTKRGVLLDGLFRFLTQNNEGYLNLNYIPYDKAFVNLRDGAQALSGLSLYDAHANSILQKSSASRGSLGFRNHSVFNEHWDGSLNINYVTDDYFIEDFSSVVTDINKDQLFNQAELKYDSEYWHFASRLQEYQTLHRIGAVVAEQYKRLPQIVLGGDFPDAPGGLNYKFNSEIVNFVKRDDFGTLQPAVGGGRFNVAPDISLPLNWMGGYIVPKVQLQATAYSVHDQTVVGSSGNITRLLPLISVDGRAVFSKNINFFQHSYSHTLEPRLFYLYIPTKNQDSLPLFDTNISGFGFSNLFRANRFNGIDRVGDANQITAAIITRLFDDSGQEKLYAGLGQIFAIHRHQVNIDTVTDPLMNEHLSPLAGKLQYFIIPKINATADAAWDLKHHRLNTANVNLQYNDSAERVVNFWYNYTLQGSLYSSQQTVNTNLNQLGFSLGWRLWQHWNILGDVTYSANSASTASNASDRRVQYYLYGLEYDSCCWALRLVRDGIYVGDVETKYKSRTYLQFVLKGLGSRDFMSKLDSVIPGKISGYNAERTIGL